MGQRVRIDISLTAHLDVSEVWPDGDAPGVVEAADVEALIDGAGGIVEVMRNWNLGDPYVHISVTRPVSVDDTEPPRVQASDAGVAQALAMMRADDLASEDDT